MTVDPRPAMPRHVLDDRLDAAREQPLGDRSAHRRDPKGPGGERPRADGRVGSLIGDVEHRRAIDGDPGLGQIGRDQAGDETRRGLGFGWLEPRLDRGRGRVGAPVGRRHPLNPSALLVDQDGRVGPADALPERSREFTQLIAVGDVALEENEAPGVMLAKEGALLRVERKARAAADEGLGHV